MKKIESRIRGSTGFVFGQGRAVKQSRQTDDLKTLGLVMDITNCTDVISNQA